MGGDEGETGKVGGRSVGWTKENCTQRAAVAALGAAGLDVCGGYLDNVHIPSCQDNWREVPLTSWWGCNGECWEEEVAGERY